MLFYLPFLTFLFSLWAKDPSEDSGSDNYCHQTFLYISIVIAFIILTPLAIFLAIILLCLPCICLAMAFDPEKFDKGNKAVININLGLSRHNESPNTTITMTTSPGSLRENDVALKTVTESSVSLKTSSEKDGSTSENSVSINVN